jgi:hypothetical protein
LIQVSLFNLWKVVARPSVDRYPPKLRTGTEN